MKLSNTMNQVFSYRLTLNMTSPSSGRAPFHREYLSQGMPQKTGLAPGCQQIGGYLKRPFFASGMKF